MTRMHPTTEYRFSGNAFAGFSRRTGQAPNKADWAVFLLLLPTLFAGWATAIGMSPASQLNFAQAFIYIESQVLAAWWVNAAAAYGLARYWPRRLRTWQLLLAGFWLAWLPLTLFYHAHGALFQWVYPELAAGAHRFLEFPPGYFAELLRYSTPFLPLWFAAVYGYELATGRRLFAIARRPEQAQNLRVADSQPSVTVTAEKPLTPRVSPPFLCGSRLPEDAHIIAVKAEEHYIRVWAEQGTDLIRYRFQDAVADLEGCNGGAQVHRSWWVNWSHIRSLKRRGQGLKLTLSNAVEVPVSVAHKAAVRAALRRNPPASAAKH